MEVHHSVLQMKSKHHSLVSEIFSQINKNSPVSKSQDSSKFGSVHEECKIDSADFDQLCFFPGSNTAQTEEARRFKQRLY